MPVLIHGSGICLFFLQLCSREFHPGMPSAALLTCAGVAPDVFQSELLAVLQLCLLLALTPQEERGTQEKDLLAALVASTELRNKIFPPGMVWSQSLNKLHAVPV